jgi:hypothetical protein
MPLVKQSEVSPWESITTFGSHGYRTTLKSPEMSTIAQPAWFVPKLGLGYF